MPENGPTPPGLQHLRARYMDPGTGRFISRDTWAGDYDDPMSLNKWMYVMGNPVNYVDPIGYAPLYPFVSTKLVHNSKYQFDLNASFMLAFGLHKTTVAAAIASQTAWYGVDKVYDDYGNLERKIRGNDNQGLGPSATSPSQIYGGKGYKEKIRATTKNLGIDLDEFLDCFPEESEWDPFNWEHAIQTMTLRLAASTLNCPSCVPRDRLIIAGMAHNGPGFEWTQQNTENYADPYGTNYKQTTKIRWNDYFGEHSKSKTEDNSGNKLQNLWLSKLAYAFDGDWDMRFQLYRFAINMEDLVYKKGWPLPPSITPHDLYAMRYLANFKHEPDWQSKELIK